MKLSKTERRKLKKTAEQLLYSKWVHDALDRAETQEEAARIMTTARKEKYKMVEGQKIDNVNHPSHYEQTTSVECIEVMELHFGPQAVYDFCVCNAFKYIWRHKHKNGEEDLKKADWYLKKARELYDTFDEVSCYYDEDQLQRLISLRDQKDDQWQESH